jgi:DNA-directed RNA polymerase subunit RPC12/RpoP
MKISIEGIFGKQGFEMSDAAAMQLLCIANRMANADTKEPLAENEPKENSMTTTSGPLVIPDPAPAHKSFAETHPPIRAKQAPRNSRVSRMFGDRGGVPMWNDGAYKGFILAKCENCGKVKGVCFREPQKDYICAECGKKTPLHDLKPAYLHCSCGGDFHYKTNITDSTFEYACMDCGKPVELIINKTRTAYVTRLRGGENADCIKHSM